MAIRGSFRWDSATQKMVAVEKKIVEVNAPTVISDEIDRNNETLGKHFTSRSAEKKAIKAAGFEEIGQERGIASKRENPNHERDVREAVEKAYYDVKYGNAPLSEKEREQCKRMNERLSRGE